MHACIHIYIYTYGTSRHLISAGRARPQSPGGSMKHQFDPYI